MGDLKRVVDTASTVWSIGASIYDHIKTSAMEEQIHTLESVITTQQRIIVLLIAGLVVLFTYILLRKMFASQVPPVPLSTSSTLQQTPSDLPLKTRNRCSENLSSEIYSSGSMV